MEQKELRHLLETPAPQARDNGIDLASKLNVNYSSGLSNQHYALILPSKWPSVTLLHKLDMSLFEHWDPAQLTTGLCVGDIHRAYESLSCRFSTCKVLTLVLPFSGTTVLSELLK